MILLLLDFLMYGKMKAVVQKCCDSSHSGRNDILRMVGTSLYG